MATLPDQCVTPLMDMTEDRLRLVIDTMPALVWSALPDGSRDFLNQRWLDYTGLSLAAGLGWGWKTVFHPQDLATFEAQWRTAVADGQALETEVRLRSAAGDYRWFLLRAVPLRDGQGTIVKWYGTHTDIEDRKWAETLLAGENRLLEQLASGEPLVTVLDGLCQLVEAVTSGYRVSILLLDPQQGRLHHAAAPSLPASYTDRVEEQASDACWGPCGIAASRREPVIIADIAHSTLNAAYRALAQAHGLRACWSTPILSSTAQVLGTFAIYARQTGRPTRRQQQIIDQMTHLAAVAIERATAAEQLRRSEAYLAAAQQLSLTGNFSWQPANGDIRWSEETFRLYGYSPTLKPTLDLARQRIHPDDRALFETTVQQAVQNGQDFEFAHRLLLPEGTVKHVRVVARAAHDAAGRLVEFWGAVMDVTAQQRVQQSLAQTCHDMQVLKEQFQLAVDTIPGLVWTALPDGHIDFLNQRWREYTGLTLAAASGWGWQVAIHPDDVAGLVAYWKTVLASGAPGETEARLRRFDGVYRWFLFRGVPLYDESGQLCKWYGQTTDIDDRKRAEEQLRRSEAYLAEAQKLSRTGSFGWSVASGRLVWSAETFCILGYERTTKPTLDRVLQRVHPDDLPLVQQALTQAAAAGSRLDFEHRLLLPNGTIKHVHVVAQAFRDKSDQREFIGALMDITERKQAAEALRASEQLARGQVLALTRTLDALGMEVAPDRLVAHVLRTLIEQLHAHSCSVWRREEAGDRVAFECAFEHGGLITRSDALSVAGSPLLRIDEVWPWPEVFRTGELRVLDDIRAMPAFPGCAHVRALGVVTLLMIPMLIAGRVEGVISIHFTRQRYLRAEELELAQALANQAILALQLTWLSARRREAAVVAERNRLAREIHDTLAQGLTGVIVQLEAGEDALSRQLVQEAGGHFVRARELARDSLREARRSVQALRPQSLEDRELYVALAELLHKMTAGTALQADFVLHGTPGKLPAEWEENLLRIGQEVLTNALRHAHAQHFAARLDYGRQAVSLELRDDGQGFDPLRRHDGFGLRGIRERVEGMGGQLSIVSAPGQGVAMTITLPPEYAP